MRLIGGVAVGLALWGGTTFSTTRPVDALPPEPAPEIAACEWGFPSSDQAFACVCETKLGGVMVIHPDDGRDPALCGRLDEA